MKQFTMSILIFLIPFLGNSQNVIFKKLTPCSFSIEIPVDMKIKSMYDDTSPDYCDYEVSLKDGYGIMELHSMNNSRFELIGINEFYAAALESSQLNITYQSMGLDYFVISGINEENGNIVYWKRVLGDNFVSDLHIEYDETKKSSIEQHIERISKSFTSN